MAVMTQDRQATALERIADALEALLAHLKAPYQMPEPPPEIKAEE